MKKEIDLKYNSLKKERMELTLKLDFKRMSGEGRHKSTEKILKRIKMIDVELLKLNEIKERGEEND